MNTGERKVVYYETGDGNCPVMDFIDSRRKRNQAKILSYLSLLQDKVPKAEMRKAQKYRVDFLKRHKKE